MFVACRIWCLADVSSVSPSSEQTVNVLIIWEIVKLVARANFSPHALESAI